MDTPVQASASPTIRNDRIPTATSTPEALDLEVAHVSYEEARAELVEIITQLERGAIALEDSLTLWERGEALARRCAAWLDGARARLDAARAATDTAEASAPAGAPAAAEASAEAGAEATVETQADIHSHPNTVKHV